MSDPMDGPEGEAMELVMPFVVCASNGGPYDDESFAAGWQAAQIAASLEMAELLHVTELRWPIFRTALTKQADLIAMRYGFAHVSVETTEEWPEWGALTVAKQAPSE